MLYLACFLLTSELETCSTLLLWLNSPTSSGTTDSLLIFAEQDPGLPSLHPTGGMLRTDHHTAAGCVSWGWAAFQVFLHDQLWWGWWGWAHTHKQGQRQGQKQPPAPDLGGLAGFVLHSKLSSKCSLLWFTHSLVSFQCCCQDPLPSPRWAFFPPSFFISWLMWLS